MRAQATRTLIKFGIFAVVMAIMTAFLFFIFGQVRTGATNGYSAVFADARSIGRARRFLPVSMSRHTLVAML